MSKKHVSGQLKDLVDLANRLSLPADAFDGEVEEACNYEARRIKESIEADGWLGKLVFLYHHGFEPERLRKMIEEMARDPQERT